METSPQVKPKKPFYKSILFWIFGAPIILAIVIVGVNAIRYANFTPEEKAAYDAQFEKDSAQITKTVSSSTEPGSDGRFQRAGDQINVKAEDFGKDWPFKIKKGFILCRNKAVFFSDNNRIWPLNGTAKTLARTSGMKDNIDDIWLDDPAMPGTKISIGEFITEGLKLCE